MSEPIRVLLVDDEESFWRPMGQRLTENSFLVEVATSGREALARAQACKGKYHVAVIDQVMGPPNGTEIMLQLRRLYPDIEAIILTGWGDMEPGEKAVGLGAHRYMSKPITADELALNIRIAVRFGQERQRRIALQALVRAGQNISGVQSEQELYDRLYEEARELLPELDGFLVSHYDEQNRVVSFPYCYIQGERLSLPQRKDNGITEFVIRKEEPLLLPKGDEAFRQEHGIRPPDPRVGYCTSEIVAPMFLQGRVLGTINARTYQTGVRYTEEHLNVFQAFANQVAVTAQNVKQLEEASRLRDAVAALASQRGKTAVLWTIVRKAHDLIDSDFVGLTLQDEDGTLYRVTQAIPEDYCDRFSEPRQQGGVTRAVIEDLQPRVIPDTHQDPLVKECVRAAGVRSMLAMPLIYRNRVLGVLYAHTFARRYFSQHDIDLWSAFAIQAAAVLHNAVEELREFEDAKRLASGLGTLTEKLDRVQTMTRVASAAKAIFRSDTCRLAYIDPPTGHILDWAWAEGDPEQYRYESEPRPDGITRYVLQTKKPVFRSDVDIRAEPSTPPGLLEQGLKSFASLPLVHNGRVIAVLHYNYIKKQKPFSEREKTLFEAFSARAAMALDRARGDQVSEIWQQLDRQIATCTTAKTLYLLFAQQARLALTADFSIFYPYDLTAPPGKPGLIEEDCAQVGELLTPWQPPQGGFGGGVHQEMDQAPNGLLIVNDLENLGGRLGSHLAEREGVKAFIALHLEVLPEGQTEPRVAGSLFLNFRECTAFELDDLVGLRLAGNRIAAAIHKLQLLGALHEQWEQRNQQLRAAVNIFQALRERRDGKVIMKRIAEASKEALGIDVCTLLEYDQKKGRFSIIRGAAGLVSPDVQSTAPEEFKSWFLNKAGPTVIPDVRQDKRMLDSGFVQREGIQSFVVYPLRVENEPLGLLFADYRYLKEPTPDELETIGLFADFAATVLHEARLQEELGQTQKRLRRRTFLTWVSMLEDIWRHSTAQKAAAIRNYSGILLKRFAQCSMSPPTHQDIRKTITEIDRLAGDIASAPPRVPQSWEMKAEFFPLAPLLKEVAQREGESSLRSAGPPLKIRTRVEALGGVQVRGYRRWLIYTLEALLQNSRNAVPQEGGMVIINGLRVGEWAEVRIRDTGSGVPEAIRSTIFKDLTPTEQDKAGMGLGCLLAATIVEDHTGTIELEKPGPGDTTVLIRLPVAKGPKE